MKRQYAIVSAGRTASTSLYASLVGGVQQRGAVRAIWDWSPAGPLRQAYAERGFDYLVVKGETVHFLEHLEARDRTTLIVLTRGNHLKQITSHLVSLHNARFHTDEEVETLAFRVERNEFLFLAHLILAAETCFTAQDFATFDQVERWRFEDLVADFPGHLARLGLSHVPPARLTGVHYDETSISNRDEVLEWARALVPFGLRVPVA